uniref:FZ domain-containing protein n=1 Tax=Heterorhabditis bacteriophora TaxID=37862 RepID=A0A1I7WZ51_HETBA
MPSIWFWLAVGLILLDLRLTSTAYLSESWAILSSERPNGPRCVTIPQNLSICYGIQLILLLKYDQMRIPNLLEHETLNEVVHQSGDWKSLLQLNCHPDTQLFLCSLFAPICLPTMDKEILPCRSLCQAVKQKQGKSARSDTGQSEFPFSFIRPLRLNRYRISARDISCPACNQVGTYENLVDHFCRSQLVLKAKVGQITGTHISLRNGRSLKKGDRRRSIEDTGWFR